MRLAAAVPGGSAGAWPHVKAIMQGISAKAGAGDEPCCQWVGNDGAGHYVKMVHNGIEYGDMQLICEAYHLMGSALGMGCDEMAAVFALPTAISYVMGATPPRRSTSNGTPPASATTIVTAQPLASASVAAEASDAAAGVGGAQHCAARLPGAGAAGFARTEKRLVL